MRTVPYIKSKIKFETGNYSWKYFQNVAYLVAGEIVNVPVCGNSAEEIENKRNEILDKASQQQQDWEEHVAELNCPAQDVGFKVE